MMDVVKKSLRKISRPFTHPFAKFLSKKAVFYLIVAFVAFTFIFLFPRLMSGNPVDRMISGASPTSPGQVWSATKFEEMRNVMMTHFGLDKPLHEQYVSFWGQLARGDLGLSFSRYPLPVARLIMWRLPFTLSLLIPVLLISFFLGNWIGARSAYLKGKWNDLAYFLSIFGQQMPFFWLAMIVIFLFAVNFGLFPTHGWISKQMIPTFSLNTFLDVAHHYILPFLVLLVTHMGGWATGMRAMMLYEKNSDYILYAKQLGFRKNKLRSYAQRNAILPQFTGLNLMFNVLVGATMIIEIVFGWPGIGLLTYNAVFNVDYPLILGCFLITMVVVLIGNFLIDIAYGFIDPRIRTGYTG